MWNYHIQYLNTICSCSLPSLDGWMMDNQPRSTWGSPVAKGAKMPQFRICTSIEGGMMCGAFLHFDYVITTSKPRAASLPTLHPQSKIFFSAGPIPKLVNDPRGVWITESASQGCSPFPPQKPSYQTKRHAKVLPSMEADRSTSSPENASILERRRIRRTK